jgi:hypothetical protein
MVASSDLNDWVLLERIAKTKKPVVISSGGSSLKDLDDVVTLFANRNIPLAVNHCVSIYPSEDSELELNQIDFLRARYPNKAKAIRPSASTILRAPTRRFRRCARPYARGMAGPVERPAARDKVHLMPSGTDEPPRK